MLFFARNGTIKKTCLSFLSFVFELSVVRVLTETCHLDNSRLAETVPQMRLLCICVTLCYVSVCRDQKMCQSPEDDVE